LTGAPTGARRAKALQTGIFVRSRKPLAVVGASKDRIPPSASRPGKPDDRAASSAFRRGAVLHGGTSSAGDWRSSRTRPTPTSGRRWPTSQEPFFHRKKSLPCLRAETCMQMRNSLNEALEHACAGMCSKRTPVTDVKPSTFPLQIDRADARTRTGDPFITSYGQLSLRVIASRLRRLVAPNLLEWR
jgi:hypothetical protein